MTLFFDSQSYGKGTSSRVHMKVYVSVEGIISLFLEDGAPVCHFFDIVI